MLFKEKTISILITIFWLLFLSIHVDIILICSEITRTPTAHPVATCQLNRNKSQIGFLKNTRY